MNTEANVDLPGVLRSNRLTALGTGWRVSPGRLDSVTEAARVDRACALPVSAQVGTANRGRFAPHGRSNRLGWLRLAGCAALFLAVTFAAVHVAIQVLGVIPREGETAQSVCFVTAWKRTLYPSPFDDLCRK